MAYIAAQIVGGCLGAVVANLVFELYPFAVGGSIAAAYWFTSSRPPSRTAS